MNQSATVDKIEIVKVTIYLTEKELRDLKIAASKADTGIARLGQTIIEEWLYGPTTMGVDDEE